MMNCLHSISDKQEKRAHPGDSLLSGSASDSIVDDVYIEEGRAIRRKQERPRLVNTGRKWRTCTQKSDVSGLCDDTCKVQ